MATFLAGEQSVRERAEAAHGAGKVQLLDMFILRGVGHIVVQLNISNYLQIFNLSMMHILYAITCTKV